MRQYERVLSFAALAGGFIIDNLTLARVDLWFDHIILLFYLGVVMLGVAISNRYGQSALGALVYFPMQFAFGGLFSVFTVFYLRSAAFAVSWPFLLFLAGMLVGNEFFRSRYQKINFQVSVLFLALFSYMVFAVPVVLGRMGPDVFILSGVLSLCIIVLFLASILRSKDERGRMLRNIAGIFVVMNVLYFTNIIPPVPLSLKEAGVYHAVVRTQGGYFVSREIMPWYKRFLRQEVVHIRADEPMYFYSAVFAPTRLNTDIVHHWQYFDKKSGSWITGAKILFPIVGGGDGGYRGYSFKNAVLPGLWRIDVETSRGQVLGRATFFVALVERLPALETIKK